MGSLVLKPLTALSRLALVAAVALLSAPVWAEPSPSEISVARRLFEEGKQAEDGSRWRDAAEKFRRAAAIKDTPGIRFHLARCEEEQGALVEALVEYDRAAELLEAGAKAGDVAKLLPDARARVQAKVASLTLRAPGGAAGVSVELDGKPVSATVLGVPLPINPGKHRVRAEATGRAPYTQEVELSSGETRELDIALGPPLAPALTAPPHEPAPAASASRSVAPVDAKDASPPAARTVVLVGEATLFAVALGSGIAFTFVRSAASDRYDQANQRVLEAAGPDPNNMACRNALPGCSDLQQAREDREQAAVIQATGFVTAGVAAAALGLTYWLWPNRSVSPQVAVVPGSAELALRGRF